MLCELNRLVERIRKCGQRVTISMSNLVNLEIGLCLM